MRRVLLINNPTAAWISSLGADLCKRRRKLELRSSHGTEQSFLADLPDFLSQAVAAGLISADIAGLQCCCLSLRLALCQPMWIDEVAFLRLGIRRAKAEFTLSQLHATEVFSGLEHKVQFSMMGVELKPGEVEKLVMVAKLLCRHQSSYLLVEGHSTPPWAPRSISARLSRIRAEKVALELRRHDSEDIIGDRLKVSWHGSDRPLAAVPDTMDDAHRRVELYFVLGGMQLPPARPAYMASDEVAGHRFGEASSSDSEG